MRRRELIALLGGATVADIRDIRITNDEKRARINVFPSGVTGGSFGFFYKKCLRQRSYC